MSAIIIPFKPMAELPNRIRELRLARNITLEQLAEMMNSSAQYISQLERGVRRLQFDWMERFARAFGVEVGELLTKEHNSLSLSSDERDLLNYYRSMDDAQRDQLNKLMDVVKPFTHAAEITPFPSTKKRPKAG